MLCSELANCRDAQTNYSGHNAEPRVNDHFGATCGPADSFLQWQQRVVSHAGQGPAADLHERSMNGKYLAIPVLYKTLL